MLPSIFVSSRSNMLTCATYQFICSEYIGSYHYATALAKLYSTHHLLQNSKWKIKKPLFIPDVQSIAKNSFLLLPITWAITRVEHNFFCFVLIFVVAFGIHLMRQTVQLMWKWNHMRNHISQLIGNIRCVFDQFHFGQNANRMSHIAPIVFEMTVQFNRTLNNVRPNCA